jgi:hypothetical protein
MRSHAKPQQAKEPDSGATSTACPIFPAPQEHRIFSGTRLGTGDADNTKNTVLYNGYYI